MQSKREQDVGDFFLAMQQNNVHLLKVVQMTTQDRPLIERIDRELPPREETSCSAEVIKLPY